MSWQLTAADLPDLARGATLLGTGGGGDPYIGKMLVERVLGRGASRSSTRTSSPTTCS